MSDERRTFFDLADRHRHDPKFHNLVEMMVAMMIQDQVAPDEIRDAAFVASVKFMALRPVRNLVYTDDTLPPHGR